jgi:antitoxin ParD1/3/4
MPSSYPLGIHFEALIKGLVESGRYDNASEVVRDGVEAA